MQKVDVSKEFYKTPDGQRTAWRLIWSVRGKTALAIILRDLRPGRENHAVLRLANIGAEFSAKKAEMDKFFNTLNLKKQKQSKPYIAKYKSTERLVFDFPELKTWRDQMPEAFSDFDFSLDGFVAREIKKTEDRKTVEAIAEAITAVDATVFEQDSEMLGSW